MEEVETFGKLSTFSSGSKPREQRPRTAGGGWMAQRSVGGSTDDDDQRPFALALMAGGCASATVDVAIHPLDTLKTRLQAPGGFISAGGYRGLFRGVVPAALGAVPGGSVFFGTYEYTKYLITPVEPDASQRMPQWWADAVAATAAAMASCLVRNPAAVVTQRLQVGQFGTLFEAVGEIGASGVSGFFRGLGASMARHIAPSEFVC